MQVRNRAADNLGALTALSARVDQLAQDLAMQGRTAQPQVRSASAGEGRGGEKGPGLAWPRGALTMAGKPVAETYPPQPQPACL